MLSSDATYMQKGRRKNYKGTRLIRSFTCMVGRVGEKKPSRVYENGVTRTQDYNPEMLYKYSEFGLDSIVKLGRKDWEKLGQPTRIKVVIYNIDD